MFYKDKPKLRLNLNSIFIKFELLEPMKFFKFGWTVLPGALSSFSGFLIEF